MRWSKLLEVKSGARFSFTSISLWCKQVTPPLAWWATAFIHAVAAQSTFVLVAIEWDAPICISRAWCLWEIYAAIRANRSVAEKTLQIAMPRHQLVAFRRKLLEDVHAVQKSILRIDAANAQVYGAEAKAMIFGAIEQHEFNGVASFDGLNAIVRRLLQGWIAASGR